MRYSEIKESTISQSSLNSKPLYIDAVNELLRQNKVLPVGSKGEYSFQPNPGQTINALQDAIAGQGKNVKGEDSDQIKALHIYKSAEIIKIAKGKQDDKISFNAGEIAEGIHATAAFVRLTTRPSKKINLANLYPIVERLHNGKTLILKAKEVDSDIADEFTLTVSLKKQTFDAFKQLPKISTYKKISTIISNIIDDANQESGRYADMYEKNGRFDLVQVVGDGVSGETETKTDINFENETERKYKGYSIKAGSTNQIHQVGGGRMNIDAEERFDIINRELFGVHGRAQLVDIESAREKFVQLWNSGKVFTAYRHAYKAAVNEINNNLQSDSDENNFVKNLVTALKYWMRRDEEGIVLKQFTGTRKGTYILNAEKLDELQNEGLNLIAKMANTEDPSLVIQDADSGDILVSVRARSEERESGYYFRNVIDKGRLFVKLTDISKNLD